MNNALGYALNLEARGFVAEANEMRRLHAVNRGLLNALTTLAAVCERKGIPVEAARAAIAKAEESV